MRFGVDKNPKLLLELLGLLALFKHNVEEIFLFDNGNIGFSKDNLVNFDFNFIARCYFD